MRGIGRRPELTDRVASLPGPDLIIWRSNFQVKQPAAKAVGDAENGTAVPRHQDDLYLDLQPQLLVSARIAVTESNKENGCLQVVAGSHRQTIEHDVDAGRHEFERSVPEDAIDQNAVPEFVLHPGEFVLFNENTMHSSGPDRTLRPRVGLTPRISVPSVRVTGNTRSAGPDRTHDAPDELREVAMLRGRDCSGRQRVVSIPCGEHRRPSERNPLRPVHGSSLEKINDDANMAQFDAVRQGTSIQSLNSQREPIAKAGSIPALPLPGHRARPVRDLRQDSGGMNREGSRGLLGQFASTPACRQRGGAVPRWKPGSFAHLRIFAIGEMRGALFRLERNSIKTIQCAQQ